MIDFHTDRILPRSSKFSKVVRVLCGGIYIADVFTKNETLMVQNDRYAIVDMDVVRAACELVQLSGLFA